MDFPISLLIVFSLEKPAFLNLWKQVLQNFKHPRQDIFHRITQVSLLEAWKNHHYKPYTRRKRTWHLKIRTGKKRCLLETSIFRLPKDFCLGKNNLPVNPTSPFLSGLHRKSRRYQKLPSPEPPLARKSLELFDWLSWRRCRAYELDMWCFWRNTDFSQKMFKSSTP